MKNNWIRNICDEVNDSSNRTNIFWDKIKLLRKGLNRTKALTVKMMTKNDRTKCTNAGENAEVFHGQ